MTAPFGFLRVAPLPARRAADPEGNVTQMLRALPRPRSGGPGPAVPELSLTGYTGPDLFSALTLVGGAGARGGRLARQTANPPMVLVVGLPAHEGGSSTPPPSCRAGKVLAGAQELPPNYREYYEERWFRPRSTPCRRRALPRGTVPFSADLILRGVGARRGLGVESARPLAAVPQQLPRGGRGHVDLTRRLELVCQGRVPRELVKVQSGRTIAGYVYATPASTSPPRRGSSAASSVAETGPAAEASCSSAAAISSSPTSTPSGSCGACRQTSFAEGVARPGPRPPPYRARSHPGRRSPHRPGAPAGRPSLRARRSGHPRLLCERSSPYRPRAWPGGWSTRR